MFPPKMTWYLIHLQLNQVILFIQLFLIMNALREILISKGDTDEETMSCDEETLSGDEQLNHPGNEVTPPSPQPERVLSFIIYIN